MAQKKNALVHPEVSARQRSDKGAGLVEYVLLIMLIAIIAIAGMRTMGTHLSHTFSDITSRLDDEMHPD